MRTFLIAVGVVAALAVLAMIFNPGLLDPDTYQTDHQSEAAATEPADQGVEPQPAEDPESGEQTDEAHEEDERQAERRDDDAGGGDPSFQYAIDPETPDCADIRFWRADEVNFSEDELNEARQALLRRHCRDGRLQQTEGTLVDDESGHELRWQARQRVSQRTRRS